MSSQLENPHTYHELSGFFTVETENLDRHAAQDRIYDLLQTEAKDRGFQTQRRRVAIPGEFSIYAETLEISLSPRTDRASPSAIEATSAILLDLSMNPVGEKTGDAALAPAFAVRLMDLYLGAHREGDSPPEPLDLVILGGQYGPDMDYGYQAWANHRAGRIPPRLIHLRIPSLALSLVPRLINPGPGLGGGDLSTLATRLTARELILDPWTFLGARIITGGPLEGALEAEGGSLLILDPGPALDQPIDGDTLALSLLETALRKMEPSGRHFMLLSRAPYRVLDETSMVMILSLLVFVHILLVYLKRHLFWQAWVSLRESTGDLSVFMLVWGGSFTLTWAAVTLTGFMADHPTGRFLALGLGTVVLFFALMLTPLRKAVLYKSRAYGILSLVSSWTLAGLLLTANPLWAPMAVGSLILSLPQKDYRRIRSMVVRMVLFLSLPLAIVLTLGLTEEGREFIRIMGRGYLVPLGWVLLGSLPAISEGMATISNQRLQSRPQARLGLRITTVIMMSLGLGSAVVLVATLPRAPITTRVTYREAPDTAPTLAWVITGAGSNGSLMYQDEVVTLDMARGTAALANPPPADFSGEVEVTPFFGRTSVSSMLRGLEESRGAKLIIRASEDLQVFWADHRFLMEDPRTVVVDIGPYPPPSLTVNLDILSKGILEVWVRTLVDDYPPLGPGKDFVGALESEAVLERLVARLSL